MKGNKYYETIKDWDWEGIVEDAKSEPTEDYEGNKVGYAFLGTVMALYPSGKYYTPFACSNVTEEEANKDKEFEEALNMIAEEYDGWIERGEGDPCDILFTIPLDGEND